MALEITGAFGPRNRSPAAANIVLLFLLLLLGFLLLSAFQSTKKFSLSQLIVVKFRPLIDNITDFSTVSDF